MTSSAAQAWRLTRWRSRGHHQSFHKLLAHRATPAPQGWRELTAGLLVRRAQRRVCVQQPAKRAAALRLCESTEVRSRSVTAFPHHPPSHVTDTTVSNTSSTTPGHKGNIIACLLWCCWLAAPALRGLVWPRYAEREVWLHVRQVVTKRHGQQVYTDQAKLFVTYRRGFWPGLCLSLRQ